MSAAIVSAPQTVEDLGIRRNVLEGLALKILYVHGEMSVLELADAMYLRYNIVEELFTRLRKDELCEVKGMSGRVFRIAITSQGRAHALELMGASQYSGPAPVSLADYTSVVRAQTVKNAEITPQAVEAAVSHLVLDDQVVTQLGTAVVSGEAIFLYGSTGSGKTSIAEAIPRIYQDSILIPYAVEVDGQIIAIYDSHVHEKIDEPLPDGADGRWVRCRRPCVVAGGELTLEMLDLQFNALTKFYSAPLQMKANGGILIVDDFGRQRMRPQELLNRWIVPLDRRIDFLTLVGGKKFEIPFDLFVAFATNLDPNTLAEEAFLRRIQSKVKIDKVTPEQFHEIFRRVCHKEGLAYEPIVVQELIEQLGERPLRACYPRDLIRQICWAARYQGKTPRLDLASVTQACHNYFVSA
jgi:predicted ATPase with chaperone activity